MEQKKKKNKEPSIEELEYILVVYILLNKKFKDWQFEAIKKILL